MVAAHLFPRALLPDSTSSNRLYEPLGHRSLVDVWVERVLDQRRVAAELVRALSAMHRAVAKKSRVTCKRLRDSPVTGRTNEAQSYLLQANDVPELGREPRLLGSVRDRLWPVDEPVRLVDRDIVWLDGTAGRRREHVGDVLLRDDVRDKVEDLVL